MDSKLEEDCERGLRKAQPRVSSQKPTLMEGEN